MKRLKKTKKTKVFSPTHNQLNQAVEQFLKQGGKINKVQTEEEKNQISEQQNVYNTKFNISIDSLLE